MPAQEYFVFREAGEDDVQVEERKSQGRGQPCGLLEREVWGAVQDYQGKGQEHQQNSTIQPTWSLSCELLKAEPMLPLFQKGLNIPSLASLNRKLITRL